jgi:hypothetical protein
MNTKDEYVIAATGATALIVASLIRAGELPRLYNGPRTAMAGYLAQPEIMQQRYHLICCGPDGSAVMLAARGEAAIPHLKLVGGDDERAEQRRNGNYV